MSARRLWLAAALCLPALPAWAQMQPNVIIDQPIEVTLARPTNGQQFVVGTTMIIGVAAFDPDDNIQQVACYVDNVIVGTGPEGSECSWVVTAGSHSVKGRATNDHYPTAKSAYTPTITITTVANTLPTVSLTAPANGAIYAVGATVPMTATASDSDGTIARVEFWVDGSKVGQATTSPYAYNWTATTGAHNVLAKAIDDANGTTSTSAVTITGNLAPTVSLTAPANGAVYTVGATVPMTATASDSGGSVDHVEFWVDGAKVGQDSVSPYAYNWTATAGSHTVLAKAIDNLTATTSTAAITITGNAPPTVSLTAPANGASTLVGAYTSMTATASDTGGSIDHVEFLVDGATVGSDYASPYAYDWPTTAGAHTVQAKAVDNQGATTTTAARTIHGNDAPTVYLSTPANGAPYAIGATVAITASSSDSDGTIARVEFWVDGAKVGQATSSPYAYNWTATSGNHAIQAKAVDDYAALTTSGTATIHVAAPVAGSLTRVYTYDSAQRLCSVAEPETGVTAMGYDAAGNLAWSASGLPTGTLCDAAGTTTAILARKAARTFDARNRIATLTFPDLNGNQSWTYTPDGLPDTVTTYNDGGTTSVVNSYAYNKRRLLAGESSSQPGWYTWSVGYGYDPNGHLASHTYPDGLSVTYAPNALGQPTQAGTYATNVTYYPNGAIAGFTYGNGIVHTLTQNMRGLPDRSKDADGATSIHDDSYDYDTVGNVLAISDAVTGNRGNRDMVYDDLNRLESATSPMFGTASYTYDVQDNLRHVAVTGGSQVRDQDYCYDAANRLTNLMTGGTPGLCNGTSVVGLGYDVQGNLANKNGTLYGFDYGNRLRSVAGLEGYRYDARGRRVLAWSPATGNILSAYGQDGVLRFQQNQRNQSVNLDYVYLGGSLVAIRSQDLATGVATVEYQHTDALGSPVVTTDSSRNPGPRREYEPYGYQTLPTTLEDGPGYTGHVTDAATGLVYMQQRYYDPELGVFPSADPVAVDSTTAWNFCRYCYGANNPYKFTDPDGRQVSINLNKPGTPEYRFAEKYKNKPGEVSVSGHGDSRAIADDRNRGEGQSGRVWLYAPGLSDVIKSSSDYTLGSTITILNCNAANGDNSLAEKVNKILGNPVQASPALLEGNPNTGEATPFKDDPTPQDSDHPDGNHQRDPGEEVPFREFPQKPNLD